MPCVDTGVCVCVCVCYTSSWNSVVWTQVDWSFRCACISTLCVCAWNIMHKYVKRITIAPAAAVLVPRIPVCLSSAHLFRRSSEPDEGHATQTSRCGFEENRLRSARSIHTPNSSRTFHTHLVERALDARGRKSNRPRFPCAVNLETLHTFEGMMTNLQFCLQRLRV